MKLVICKEESLELCLAPGKLVSDALECELLAACTGMVISDEFPDAVHLLYGVFVIAVHISANSLQLQFLQKPVKGNGTFYRGK